MLKKMLSALALAAILIQAPAHAAVFDEESGFGPDGVGFGSCRGGTTTAAFATGTVIASSDV